MRRIASALVLAACLAAAAPADADFPIPRPPDSDAPPGSAPHWLPPDAWVHHHYVPFDEARLYALLHTDRAALWAWLRDDNRTLAEFAAAKGQPDAAALAARLVAPRAADVDAAMLRQLRSRTLRVLRQGHLAQHVIFHSLHQEAGPEAAAALFGVRSTSAFQRLRRLDISPLQIGRLHGRTRAQMQRGLERVLRDAADHGVHHGDMSERQAQTLLRRQLRQVPRWLAEEHYNGPPQTVGGKPRFPFRPSFAAPALAGDGGLVLFDAAQPAPPLAVRFGEVVLGGRDLRSGAALDPRDASPVAQEDRPCSSFDPSLSSTGRFAAYELSAGNRTFAKRYGNVVVAVADLQERTLRRVAGGATGRSVETAYAPSISGDGRRVAFASVIADPMSPASSSVTRVVVADVATGARSVVPRAGAYEPALSADGNRVAYTAFGRGGRLQVYVYDLARRHSTLVSRGAAEAWAPSISGDGRRVAFAATTRTGGRGRILVRDLARARPTAVTPASADVADQPALSADGTHVAYTRLPVRGGADRLDRPVQHVVVRDIARHSSVVPAVDPRSWSGQPQLSADGAVLAFTTDSGVTAPGPGGLRVVIARPGVQTVSPAAPPSTFDGGTAALQPGATRMCDMRPPAW